MKVFTTHAVNVNIKQNINHPFIYMKKHNFMKYRVLKRMFKFDKMPSSFVG